ncbi:hypothetical protein UF06_23070 [Vibrio sp. S234-5]|nr:hypothetical protein UF06_23070 [Vibrio sp. S234-5]
MKFKAIKRVTAKGNVIFSSVGELIDIARIHIVIDGRPWWQTLLSKCIALGGVCGALAFRVETFGQLCLKLGFERLTFIDLLLHLLL